MRPLLSRIRLTIGQAPHIRGACSLRRIAPYPAQALRLDLRYWPLPLESPRGGLVRRCPEGQSVSERLFRRLLYGVVSVSGGSLGPALGLAADDDAVRELVQVLAVTDEALEKEPVTSELAQSQSQAVE